MSASNRAAILTKVHRVLKKHYQPVAPPSDRGLLEHLLYACCLENSAHEAADEAFARLQEMFFDWNEVRVTTIAELSEALRMVPAPSDAATRLKQVLQSVFETHYSFDLEFLKKENIGKAVKTLEKYHGITPFTVAYVTQIALGGHSIPIDKGVLSTFVALGVATEMEAEKQHVPGVDRAIPKTKGVEFASLLHQLGADYHASPFSQRIRSMILEIAPDAKDRFPKRSTKQKKAPKKTAKAARTKAKSTATRAGGATKKKVSKSKAVGQKAGKKKSTTKRLSRKKPR